MATIHILKAGNGLRAAPLEVLNKNHGRQENWESTEKLQISWWHEVWRGEDDRRSVTLLDIKGCKEGGEKTGENVCSILKRQRELKRQCELWGETEKRKSPSFHVQRENDTLFMYSSVFPPNQLGLYTYSTKWGESKMRDGKTDKGERRDRENGKNEREGDWWVLDVISILMCCRGSSETASSLWFQ